MITLLTPTGSRPKAFELCEKYMARQTYKGDVQWVVVDDSPNSPTPCTMGQEYYAGPITWKPGLNTQRYSLDLALSKAKGDYIFILEDDDYYAPNYLETMVNMLQYADMVGECDVTYYSLRAPRGYMEMKNYRHASTCQTAFRKSYAPMFYRALHSGEKYFDILLWNTARMSNHKTFLFSGLNLCIGMKGLPGRTGIGVGHTSHEFIADQNFVKLRALMPEEDARVYIEMVK